MKISELKEPVNKFLYAYFQERNTKKVLSYLTENVQWIDSVYNEQACTKKEVASFIEKRLTKDTSPYQVEIDHLSYQSISDDMEICILSFVLKSANLQRSLYKFDISLCYQAACIDPKISFLHISFVQSNQEEEQNSDIPFVKEELSEIHQEFIDSFISGGVMRASFYPAYQLLHMNKALVKLLGYKNQQDVKKEYADSLLDILHPDDYHYVVDMLKNHTKIDEEFHMIYRMRKKDRSYIWVAEKDKIICLNGQLQYFSFLVDITTQKHREELLEENSKRYHALIESVPGGVGMFEIQKGITQIRLLNSNRKFDDIVGIESEENRENWSPIGSIHPDDYPEMKKALQRSIENHCDISVIYRTYIKDNHTRWIKMTGNPFKTNEDGSVIFYAVFLDVDTIIQAKMTADLQTQKLQFVLDNSDLCMWTFDIYSHRIYDGSASSIRWGFPGIVEGGYEELIKNGIIHPDSIEDYRALHQRIEKGDKTSTAIIRFNIQKVAVEWEKIKYIRLLDDKNYPVYAIGIAQDYTEIKRLEKHYEEEINKRNRYLDDYVLSCKANLSSGHINSIRKWEVDGDIPLPHSLDKWFNQIAEHLIDKKEKQEFLALFNQKSLIQHCQNNQLNLQMDYRYLYESMQYKWFSLHVDMMLYPQTKEWEACIYLQDITEEKVTQEMIHTVANMDYDYLARINVINHHYIIYANYQTDSALPSFHSSNYQKEVEDYAEKYVIEEDREQNIRDMSLENVRAQLKEKDKYTIYCHIQDDYHVISYKKIQFSYLDTLHHNILVTRTDITDIHREEERQKLALENALTAAKQANVAKSEFCLV